MVLAPLGQFVFGRMCEPTVEVSDPQVARQLVAQVSCVTVSLNLREIVNVGLVPRGQNF